MPHHFHKHYTRDEARSLLPEVRHWLDALLVLRGQIQERDQQLTELMQPGCDLGGELVNEWVRSLAELKAVLKEFLKREIQIKDLDRGLIDFPSLRQGKEVFLCWEQGEEDIDFWHDIEAGYAGRQKIEEED
jgi:hypothetical protein